MNINDCLNQMVFGGSDIITIGLVCKHHIKEFMIKAGWAGCMESFSLTSFLVWGTEVERMVGEIFRRQPNCSNSSSGQLQSLRDGTDNKDEGDSVTGTNPNSYIHSSLSQKESFFAMQLRNKGASSHVLGEPVLEKYFQSARDFHPFQGISPSLGVVSEKLVRIVISLPNPPVEVQKQIAYS